MQHRPPISSLLYFTSQDSINSVEIMPSNKYHNVVGQHNPPRRTPPSIAGLATQKFVPRASFALPDPSLASLRDCLSITRPPMGVLLSNHCFVNAHRVSTYAYTAASKAMWCSALANPRTSRLFRIAEAPSPLALAKAGTCRLYRHVQKG